jgi:hypothetical protein
MMRAREGCEYEVFEGLLMDSDEQVNDKNIPFPAKILKVLM